MKLGDARRSEQFRLIDGEWWWVRSNGRKTRARTGTCEWCGGFWVRSNDGKRPAYRFCDRSCYTESRREAGRRVRLEECEECGNEYLRGYPAQRFCSQRCWYDSNTGPGHPRYDGHVTTNNGYAFYTVGHPEHPLALVHRIVFEREHGYDTCDECGNNPVQHVHHEDGDRLNNEPSNLRGLCRPCHARIHNLGRACAAC